MPWRRRGDHLQLQAALATGNEHLVLQLPRRQRQAALAKHRGQRGGTALVGFLGKNGTSRSSTRAGSAALSGGSLGGCAQPPSIAETSSAPASRLTD